MKIIDVSKHNGVIDWKKVAADGVKGAIIRAGYGKLASQKDPTFEANYAGAVAAGLHVGAYWYSYAQTAVEGVEEAAACIECIKGKQFDLPIFFDIEDNSQVNLSKAVCTDITVAFLTKLENSGYFAGLYSFDSFFATNLEAYVRTRYALWVARVENVEPKVGIEWGIHQYSWRGKVNGISGNVDMNNCRKDYPNIIKAAHLNGYTRKNTVYEVTAHITANSQAAAGTIATACEKMGMTVVTHTKEGS